MVEQNNMSSVGPVLLFVKTILFDTLALPPNKFSIVCFFEAGWAVACALPVCFFRQEPEEVKEIVESLYPWCRGRSRFALLPQPELP